MLKITAIGNLTNDVELKMNETTGKPYAILRIASDRRYKDNIMVIHCASSENNVVVTGKSGFTSIARPTYYQELLKSEPSSSTGGPYRGYYG